MTDQAVLDWPTCDKRDCIGIRLPRGGKCLAHATARRRTVALRQLHETGEIDARGVPITELLLEHILAAAPRDDHGRATLKDARFDDATFQGAAKFSGVTFQGDARFPDATFQGTAWFNGVTFQGHAVFHEVTFQGEAKFGEVTFQGEAGFNGGTFQGTAWFHKVTFKEVTGFSHATFKGDAWFDDATFQGAAEFGEVTFQGDIGFNGATFQRYAHFNKATFQHPARADFRVATGFNQTTFQDVARFKKVTFRGDARFDMATFQRNAWFNEATFQGAAFFNEATFKGNAVFYKATFQGAWFDKATFQGAWLGGATFLYASFYEVRFEQARQLGPLLVYGVLRLDAAHFAQLIQIEASARGLSCQRTRFPAGVQFRLRGAHVVMDDADLSSPSLLTGVNTLSDARLAHRERRLVQAMRRLAPAATAELSARPQLLSVQGANLAGLAVANIDLAQCRFAGAHNLDRLRFEAEVSFAVAPARLPWDWRQVLAEERIWRTARSNRWAAGDWWPAWLDKPYSTKWLGVVEPAQIAGLYRALRKAREDAKDEPGAADFYYGEMEMRRHAGRGRTGGASRGRVERAVLTAYWLASGYGLRAWRALTALAVVLIAFAGLLVWKGYEDAASSPDAGPASTTMARPVPSSSTAAPARPSAQMAPTTTGPTSPAAPTTAPTSPAASVTDRSLVGALLYGARTIIGLNPTPAPALTRFGEVLLIAVRVLGPLLLGLALLALRGRVKR